MEVLNRVKHDGAAAMTQQMFRRGAGLITAPVGARLPYSGQQAPGAVQILHNEPRIHNSLRRRPSRIIEMTSLPVS